MAHQDDDLRATLEISRLVYRYGYLLDAADFVGIAELLAHATFGSDRLGRAAFRGRARPRPRHSGGG